MLITFCVPGAAIGSSTLYPLCVASVKVKSRSQASCQCFFFFVYTRAGLPLHECASPFQSSATEATDLCKSCAT